ncbi:hypothetical protein Tco_0898039 [Tanacetum coccineum]
MSLYLSIEHDHVVMDITVLDEVVTPSSKPAFIGRFIKRTSFIGFPAQSVRFSNADALDSPYLLVLFIGYLKEGFLTNGISTITTCCIGLHGEMAMLTGNSAEQCAFIVAKSEFLKLALMQRT